MPNNILRCNVLYEDDLWYITDMVDGELKHGYMMITKRHIKTPFDINEEEWAQLRDLIKKCKAMLDESSPDGANLGWNISPVGGQNVDHAHLHLFGRFADEPLASKGLRYAFKQPSNKRGSVKE
ncbi:MAG: HIT family protein [Candidatus Microsaccharimonas sossegonensis]|uniref:HIT family protein n=1 Tax=Candidatus Microsaccharimonas sossegonensis TaxID=2506948 RepID=A0A4Q0AIB6_9BACT|nr:MAG: HIT family protein [Candidatus Microsaccharimonas sossegonensis]